jgi:hypothetical protein
MLGGEMPSLSLTTWRTTRRAVFLQLEHAHQRVGGSGRGRRYATENLNQAFAVLLSSHFQGFCRDLHSECVNYVVAAITPPGLRVALQEMFVRNRKLDTGNPNPGNIGADFGRFGLPFWDNVRTHDARNAARRSHLEYLNHWRNAIAHQDFDPAILGSRSLQLPQVRAWHQACHHLAVSFDEVMRAFMATQTGTSPW